MRLRFVLEAAQRLIVDRVKPEVEAFGLSHAEHALQLGHIGAELREEVRKSVEHGGVVCERA